MKNPALQHPSSNLPALFLLLAVNLCIGYVASLYTRPEIAGWYAAVHKPLFNPPNGLFAPVWTVLYIVIAVSGWLVWLQRHHAAYPAARNLYTIQLLLNFSWSIVFFGQHSISGGLVVILLLDLMIVLTMIRFFRIDFAAGWLLVPYLAWVCFASVLNFSIYLLN
ncbi:MAG: tryptophan-rich sensory protein [Mucilaginibacter polytrichastri]|nr:tryptophan-rich sensory protein [Mucilaginibacter polytrichastri]